MSALTIGLVGNPNSGKTTVFNALTGARQTIGNWPGVTVERKSGVFTWQETEFEVVDLPGTYALTVVSESSSIDERIACDYILQRHADVIVNVLDASNLERSLYLTLQLLEMRVPMILAVNMLDVARQRHIKVFLHELENVLGCPVVGLEANRGRGIKELKQCLLTLPAVSQKTIYTPALAALIERLADEIALSDSAQATWLAIRLLEEDITAKQRVSVDVLQKVPAFQVEIKKLFGEDADIILADARYRFIQTIMTACVSKSTKHAKTMTAYIDDIVLHRVLGIPIFLMVMYSLFFFSITIGGACQAFFDSSTNAIFVEGPATLLTAWHAPTWLIALLANGVGKGINTTLTFVPVIGAMFLFLALLEDSGYMARAAFVIDRLMRALGLPGKSFVPMIVGFGCNVPAVMGARTLENKRDRILTVMMTPFMSCGARLAIYAVFVAAFFPKGGQNVVFALYMIGIAMAMLTGLLLRKTILKGEPAPLIMELPAYHLPRLTAVCLHAWQRLKGFVFRAGKLIVLICILLGVLGSLTVHGAIIQGDGDVDSLLSVIGRHMTPVFAPMGIESTNWPATVGLLTGILAKEVVVGTLNALYTQQGVYGLMYQQFDGQIGAMAYLLFVLLYFPCVSTTAAMVRELNRGWAAFSVVWTTGSAYGIAVAFYQAATFARHPLYSSLWLAGIALLFGAVIMAMRGYSSDAISPGRRYELA